MVGRLLSYWEGNFSGAMLNFGRVNISIIPKKLEGWPAWLSEKPLAFQQFRYEQIPALPPMTPNSKRCERFLKGEQFLILKTCVPLKKTNVTLSP